VKLLRRAIDQRFEFAIETTLGGRTIPTLLALAANRGIRVKVWYVGLSSPGLHVARVQSRVRLGGHDIPEADIRRRFTQSRLNLIALLPYLTALRVFDNSADGNPTLGRMPKPVLLLHIEYQKILNPFELKWTPEWAKSIVAAAIKLDGLG
jgi:predicted ABC-type ATPase